MPAITDLLMSCPRRTVASGAVAVVAAGGLVLWAVHPFADPKATAAARGTPTTFTATVIRLDLSSQLTLDATLGYTGSYTISYQGATTGGNSGSGPPTTTSTTTTTTDPPANNSSPAGTSHPGGSTCPSQPTSGSPPTTMPSTTIPATTTTTTTTTITTATTVPSTTTSTTGTTVPSSTTSTTSTTRPPSPNNTTTTTIVPSRAGHQQPTSTTRPSSSHNSSCPRQTSTGNHPTGSGHTSSSGHPSGSGSPSGNGQPQWYFTSLPSVGQIISQGGSLYSVNGTPIVLLYGATPAWRDLTPGVSGPDVAELNADLVRLGDATTAEIDPTSDYYGAATAAAVKNLQSNLGATQTGTLTLGQVTFLPTPIRVTAVTATLGSPVTAGTVLSGTSTTREVAATLDASKLSQVKVGDQVTITLADGESTAGVIASIGTVATSPSNTSGGSSGPSSPPTVQVGITPSDAAATGSIDQAPVTVAVTTGTVKSALAVPVAALVATPNSHPAVDITDAKGITHTLEVSLGLFDDAKGLVQISGTGIAAGLHVDIPARSPTT